MKRILLVVVICLIATTSYSQQDYTFVYQTDSIINHGIRLHDAGKYSDAIAEFRKIVKSDPKYLTAQYEVALSMAAAEQKTELKALFEELYNSKQMPLMPQLYTNYGSFLSDAEDYAASQKIFEEGEKFFPNSSNFQYNYALLQVRQKETQKAVDRLKLVVSKNPQHASAHYLLGLLALENGQLIEGSLALIGYLAIAPTGKHAANAILKLNANFGQNYLDETNVVFSKSGDDFSEIETILRNQLPLKKAYKIQSKIDDVFTRQIQAICEYAETHQIKDGFFETTYLPWLQDMMQKKQYEGFSYFILMGMEEGLGKALTSQKKKILDYTTDYHSVHFWNNFGKRNVEHFGTQQEVIIMLKDNRPYLIGSYKNGLRNGQFKLLNSYENVEAELNFKDGELHGVQKYYNNKGKLTDEKTFVNGKLDGIRKTFYSNGNPEVVETYSNGILNGLSQSFAVKGGKQCEVNFTNGERDGKSICWYSNGTIKSEAEYKAGKLKGNLLKNNSAGDKIETATYKEGELQGVARQYFDGKKISSEATYDNGKVVGTVKHYYPNDVLEQEAFYEGGKLRKTIDYFATGILSSEIAYGDDAELEKTVYYDMNGVKYFEQKFKSGILKSGLQLAPDGSSKEVSMAAKPYKIKNLAGTDVVSGTYSKGKKNGEWNFFFSNGKNKSKEIYNDGVQSGMSYSYNYNGTLRNASNYNDNNVNGVYERYDNDILTGKLHFINGDRNGPFQNFRPDGTVESEGITLNDEQVRTISYWQNGKKSFEEDFIEDELVRAITFNSKGEQENDVDYTNLNGKSTVKYANGMEIQVCDWVNGYRNGKFISKDKNGTMISEIDYVNGIRHGKYKFYNPLGTLSHDMNYYNGSLHGPYTHYDLVGNLRLVDQYLHGDSYGKT
ncbi:MAG TPA: tetratricopeptide repeat protein, partial [Flavobacterium sp.]|nr:tetratricopeptide repeat protein [Flavobacterium sp.]